MDLRIKTLLLEGYRKIYTGMNVERIYLDFDMFPYELFLFVGDSGSGKTSILRSIHPFAYNTAAGDGTINDEFIMDNRDGKKIIEYIMDQLDIVCKHLYLRKSGKIQTKSFFSVNGEELNPSGLGTTFKELVQRYFHIDESFLNLLSLGGDMKGLVERTAGERKQIAVKVFTELNIYMEYYKNASEQVKELKSVLTSVTDKLTRYQGYDKKELTHQIKDLEHTIHSQESVLETLLKQEGALTMTLETQKSAYKEYEENKAKVLLLLEQIDTTKRKRHSDMSELVIENKKEELLKQCIELELRISATETSLQSELNFKEANLSTKDTLETSIKRTEEHTNQQELHRLLASVDAELAQLVDIECSPGKDYRTLKERCVTAVAYLENLRGLCMDFITEVELKDLILPTVKTYLASKDSGQKFKYSLDAKVAAIEDRLQKLRAAHALSGKVTVGEITVKDCDKSCPYKDWYQLCMEVTNVSDEKVRGKIEQEQSDLKRAGQTRTIVYILDKLYTYIQSNMDKLNIVPLEIFDPNTFVERYMSDIKRQVYDEDKMTSIIREFELSEQKEKLLATKQDTKDRLAGLTDAVKSCEEMKVALDKLNRSLQDSDLHITSLQKDLQYNREQYDTSKKLLNELDVELKVAKELSELRAELATVKKQISTMDESRNQYEALSMELSELQATKKETQSIIEQARTTLNHAVTTLDNLNALEEEKLLLAEKYSYAELIKESVSPSKGIPMEFIDDVIRNQMIDNVNELMHIAYPDITLLKGKDELIIDEKNFTMPYKKKNRIISDISEASGGERAMLKVAFSLVIIRLISKVYNLVLLDEMDSTLDKKGRAKYIDIIEMYRKRIGARQMFLISHNNMFDMYNVNILRTTVGQSTKNSINLYEGGTTV